MSSTDTSAIDPLDRIDKSIDIDADAESVYALISRPGWWINNGTIDPDPELRVEGDSTIVVHPEYGEFRLETVTSEPPTSVAFRWHHALPDDGIARSTLVEFTIEDRTAGGVTLHVIESGFSGLSKPRSEWLQDRLNNDSGWDTELAAARAFVEK